MRRKITETSAASGGVGVGVEEGGEQGEFGREGGHLPLILTL